MSIIHKGSQLIEHRKKKNDKLFGEQKWWPSSMGAKKKLRPKETKRALDENSGGNYCIII